jgi:hypothetical protein
MMPDQCLHRCRHSIYYELEAGHPNVYDGRYVTWLGANQTSMPAGDTAADAAWLHYPHVRLSQCILLGDNLAVVVVSFLPKCHTQL